MDCERKCYFLWCRVMLTCCSQCDLHIFQIKCTLQHDASQSGDTPNRPTVTAATTASLGTISEIGLHCLKVYKSRRSCIDCVMKKLTYESDWGVFHFIQRQKEKFCPSQFVWVVVHDFKLKLGCLYSLCSPRPKKRKAQRLNTYESCHYPSP